MAKGKPNLAFLEALKQDKRRRGDSTPGGAFKAPAWFDKSAEEAATKPQAKTPAIAGPTTSAGRAGGRKGFKLTYTHFAIGSVLVVAVAAVAMVVARKPQPPQLSDSTEVVRSSPAQGNVMEVSAPPAHRPAGQPTAASTARPAAPAPIPVPPQTLAAVTAPPAAQQQPVANIAVPATSARTVGMYYVVFQSYKDAKMADDARDALAAAGVGATVEKGLDYAPTWYVVLGTQGFARTTGGEYVQYISKSKIIGEKFAGKNKWKLFEPNPYKWKGK